MLNQDEEIVGSREHSPLHRAALSDAAQEVERQIESGADGEAQDSRLGHRSRWLSKRGFVKWL